MRVKVAVLFAVVAVWGLAVPGPVAATAVSIPRCNLLGTPTALPVGVGAGCPGVRPGAQVRTPLGLCTLNFFWRGDDGASYMGTAGHCLLGSEEAEVAFDPGAGPPAFQGIPDPDGTRRRIGRFAYAVADANRDFALIRLDPEVSADPTVCFFGGPTGTDDVPLPPLATLSHVGQGRLLSSLVPARTQVLVDHDSDTIVGLGLAAPGDSGEPLLGPDGRAVGIVAATGPSVLGLPGTGLVFSTRVQPQIERATQVTGVSYTLQTAPLA